mgnify:FL=1
MQIPEIVTIYSPIFNIESVISKNNSNSELDHFFVHFVCILHEKDMIRSGDP